MKANTNHEDIQQFTAAFDVAPAWEDSYRLSPDTLQLRMDLIIEEVKNELLPAMEKLQRSPSMENLVEVADGLVDSVYVLLGAAVALDLPWQELWEEVHRSNMSKRHSDGTVRRREDGKILKPEGWKAPDLLSILLHWQDSRVINNEQPELFSSYRLYEARRTLALGLGRK